MERKVILYIAMSVDGFIAGIDTVVMGKATYHQIVTELSPDVWVYSGMKSYVFTHEDMEDTKDITFVNGDICELITTLKRTDGKDIWICGGADIVNQLLRQNLIDEYRLTMIPVILGRGIRLFEDRNETLNLRLLRSSMQNGLLECIYERKGQ